MAGNHPLVLCYVPLTLTAAVGLSPEYFVFNGQLESRHDSIAALNQFS